MYQENTLVPIPKASVPLLCSLLLPHWSIRLPESKLSGEMISDEISGVRLKISLPLPESDWLIYSQKLSMRGQSHLETQGLAANTI